jgi:two-component system LytT family response regulator
MINILIIDDDECAILVLIMLLTKISSLDINIAGTALNLEDGVEFIKRTQPDIVFLDLNMSGGNGLELFSAFKSPRFKTIICTAYSQYAITAMKIAASGYILKPIELNDLKETLIKVSKEVKQMQIQNQIEDSIKISNSTMVPGENIIFDYEDGFLMLNSQNIEYCYAINSHSGLVTFSKKEYIVKKSLLDLQKMLPIKHFYRTDKSYLVNINYIRQFVRTSESFLVMKNGAKIPVSHRMTPHFVKDLTRRFKTPP